MQDIPLTLYPPGWLPMKAVAFSQPFVLLFEIFNKSFTSRPLTIFNSRDARWSDGDASSWIWYQKLNRKITKPSGFICRVYCCAFSVNDLSNRGTIPDPASQSSQVVNRILQFSLCEESSWALDISITYMHDMACVQQEKSKIQSWKTRSCNEM